MTNERTTVDLCGRGDEHCCWLRGVVCQHLEENTAPGRRWACGLLVKYGSWPAVYDAPEYVQVRILAVASGVAADLNFRCGEWPPVGERCATCGGIGG